MQAGLPAEKAGIEAGDIITKVQGKSVERSPTCRAWWAWSSRATRSALEVFHDGKCKDVTADVIDFGPETPPTLGDAASPTRRAGAKATLGLKVTDLSDADRARLHVKGGVRVDARRRRRARAPACRRATSSWPIGNVQVTSAKQFTATVAKLDKTKPIAVLVRRGDSANYLVIRPSK